MLLFINLFSFLFYTKICVQKVPILGQNFPKNGVGGDYNSGVESKVPADRNYGQLSNKDQLID